MSDLPTVGFVGIGTMGRPMAGNLVDAGYPLVVRDADAERQAGFAAEHACVAAESPADFADVDLVVTMLPDDRAVQEALLGWEGGIASALPEGAVVVEMSSANPDGTFVLAERLAPLRIAVVDAPVSGTATRARDGTLTIMAGTNDDAAFDRAAPVLSVLGDHVFRTGPLGSGHAMKALNNYVAGATYAVTVEAIVLGLEYGLSPSTMIEIFNVSTARSFNSEVAVKEHVVTGRYASGFMLGLLAKDVAIAAALADASTLEAPVCELVSRRLVEARDALGFTADHTMAHTHWWRTDLVDPRAEASARS